MSSQMTPSASISGIPSVDSGKELVEKSKESGSTSSKVSANFIPDIAPPPSASSAIIYETKVKGTIATFTAHMKGIGFTTIIPKESIKDGATSRWWQHFHRIHGDKLWHLRDSPVETDAYLDSVCRTFIREIWKRARCSAREGKSFEMVVFLADLEKHSVQVDDEETEAAIERILSGALELKALPEELGFNLREEDVATALKLIIWSGDNACVSLLRRSHSREPITAETFGKVLEEAQVLIAGNQGRVSKSKQSFPDEPKRPLEDLSNTGLDRTRASTASTSTPSISTSSTCPPPTFTSTSNLDLLALVSVAVLEGKDRETIEKEFGRFGSTNPPTSSHHNPKAPTFTSTSAPKLDILAQVAAAALEEEKARETIEKASGKFGSTNLRSSSHRNPKASSSSSRASDSRDQLALPATAAPPATPATAAPAALPIPFPERRNLLDDLPFGEKYWKGDMWSKVPFPDSDEEGEEGKKEDGGEVEEEHKDKEEKGIREESDGKDDGGASEEDSQEDSKEESGKKSVESVGESVEEPEDALVEELRKELGKEVEANLAEESQDEKDESEDKGFVFAAPSGSAGPGSLPPIPVLRRFPVRQPSRR